MPLVCKPRPFVCYNGHIVYRINELSKAIGAPEQKQAVVESLEEGLLCATLSPLKMKALGAGEGNSGNRALEHFLKQEQWSHQQEHSRALPLTRVESSRLAIRQTEKFAKGHKTPVCFASDERDRDERRVQSTGSTECKEMELWKKICVEDCRFKRPIFIWGIFNPTFHIPYTIAPTPRVWNQL